MGTRYVRSAPLAELKEVDSNSSTIIEVENIFSEEAIGNVLSIELRQKEGAELTFV